jgi:hypothetical protein
MLHLIRVNGNREFTAPTEPVVAWGISFPKTGLEERRVEYVVNTTWFREHVRDEIDEEELEGEETE